MAINLIPFDSSKPMSDTKKFAESRMVEQATATSKVRNEVTSAREGYSPRAKDTGHVHSNKASRKKENKRKAQKNKVYDNAENTISHDTQDSIDSEFEIYTKQQTADHHLKTESLDDEHQLDVNV
jgi:hypothetical protein